MSTGKKILFLSRPLTNSFDEGSKNLVYNLCFGLRERIVVLVDNTFSQPLPNNVCTIKLPFSIDKSFLEYSTSFPVKLYLFSMLFRASQYDFVHAFFSLTRHNAIPLLIANQVFRKKIYLSIPSGKSEHLNDPAVRLLLKKAAVVCVMSKYTANKLSERGARTEIVPPLVHHGRFFPVDCSKKVSLRKKLNLKEPFIVIYPGEYCRLDANDNIIKILHEVSARCSKVLFILACRHKSTSEKKVESYIRNRIHSNGRVLFLGNVHNYHEYAAASDIGIFPVRSMNNKFDLPLSLVELIVMGKPVFYSNIPPLNELLDDSKHFSLSAEPGNFVETIIRLARDSELYSKMAEKILSEALRYRQERVIERFQSIYAKYN